MEKYLDKILVEYLDISCLLANDIEKKKLLAKETYHINDTAYGTYNYH